MHNIDKLTRLTVELEGLLHVLNHRDSENIRELLQKKYNELAGEYTSLLGYLMDNPVKQAEKELEIEDRKETNLVVNEEAGEASELADEDDLAEEAVEREEDRGSTPEIVEEEADIAPVAEEPRIPRGEEPEINTELSVDKTREQSDVMALRRMFTLNDKFLFRRTLFGQDDAKFAEALTEIASKKNIDEAKDFLQESYGWDFANPDVEEFMTVISRYFAR